MILGLSGWAGAGKDSLAEFLVNEHGYRRVAFADRVRAVALDVNPFVHLHHLHGQQSYPVRLSELVEHVGWHHAKREFPEVRRTLQALGVAVRDNLGASTWVDAALSGVQPGERVVITDVRFKNEAQAVADRGGWMVRIDRPGVEAVNDHVSEHDLDDWPFDVRVHNDGRLEGLRGRATILAVHAARQAA